MKDQSEKKVQVAYRISPKHVVMLDEVALALGLTWGGGPNKSAAIERAIEMAHGQLAQIRGEQVLASEPAD